MALEPGGRLGSFEVLSSLGAGGMGEVYRVRDARLGREVAAKILPEEFSRDAQRLARIDREARVLASLNHPNIAASNVGGGNVDYERPAVLVAARNRDDLAGGTTYWEWWAL